MENNEFLNREPISADHETANFPWVSTEMRRLKDLIESDKDWKLTLVGADSMEREMLIEAVAKSAPFYRLDCESVPEGNFEAKVFGTFRYTRTDQKIIIPGVADQIPDGFLLLENLASLDTNTQAYLPALIDQREGRRFGDYTYDQIPIKFKLVTAFDDGPLPATFNNRLVGRMGFEYHIQPLSKRPEDLRPLIEHAFLAIAKISRREDLIIADSFWQHLKSRHWPLSLGQWIHAISDFFSTKPTKSMSWDGFASACDFDFDDVIEKYDRLKRKHTIERRDFLLNHIQRASAKQELLNSLGLSWQRFVDVLNEVGLSEDGDLCVRLMKLPW